MTYFRPFFNPSTGELIQFNQTADTTGGELVRFTWRSAPGGGDHRTCPPAPRRTLHHHIRPGPFHRQRPRAPRASRPDPGGAGRGAPLRGRGCCRLQRRRHGGRRSQAAAVRRPVAAVAIANPPTTVTRWPGPARTSSAAGAACGAPWQQRARQPPRSRSWCSLAHRPGTSNVASHRREVVLARHQ